jgi:type IX secretion system PorP/SprF family membrane protein
MKKLIIISAFSVLVIQSAHSQDPVFSQFYTSSLYLNPALAGLEKDVVFGMNYRSQWAGVNLPFRTFQFSAIHPILQHGVSPKHLGGFGATLYSDEAGPNREVVSQGFSIASSYNFHLDRTGNHLISTALQFGVLQRQMNMDALRWSSQYSSVLGYDPSLPGENLISDRVTSPVIHAGMMWRLIVDSRFKPVRMYYQGIAVSNINRPKGFYMGERDTPAPLYKLHGGYSHHFADGFEVSPNYLLQYQTTLQVNVGAYAAYTLPAVISRSVTDLKVSVGLWYRVDDSIIATTGFSTGTWSAGFSYDANSSSLERNFEGSNAFEVSFAYRFSIQKTVKKFSTPLI